MKYSRIDLDKTNYSMSVDWAYISRPDINQLNFIYTQYCRYKKFESVKPLFDLDYLDTNNDIIGYYQDHNLIAFSIIRVYDWSNAEALQFAWDYAEPKLRLGMESLKTECAIYKDRGFKYLYLGGDDEYKSIINGYEVLGPV